MLIFKNTNHNFDTLKTIMKAFIFTWTLLSHHLMDRKATCVNTVSPLDCDSYLCQPDWAMIPRDLVKCYFFYHVSETVSQRDKRLKTQNEWKSYCHQDRWTSSDPLRTQSEQKVTAWMNAFCWAGTSVLPAVKPWDS